MMKRRASTSSYRLDINAILDFAVGVPMRSSPHRHHFRCSCEHQWRDYRHYLEHYRAVRDEYRATGREHRRYGRGGGFSFAETLHRSARRWPGRADMLGAALWQRRYGPALFGGHA